MYGIIIVLSGPSGAGKGRIAEELMNRRHDIRKVLSVTTRAKREDDIGKETYAFITEEKFLYMKEQDRFLETNYYDGAWYGTIRVPTEELSMRDLIFDKDVNGALAIKQAYPEAITIYVMPKDNETLLKRRGNRGENRAEIAVQEVEKAKGLDFLVINDNIEDTIQQVEEIIECMRAYVPICKLVMSNKTNIDFMDNFYK